MQPMQQIQTEYFECACHDNEHLLIINYDPEYGDIWVDVHLKNYPWYMRLWIAIKYIFGYKTKYGCFSTWMMNNKDAQKMIDLINKKEAFDEQQKKDMEVHQKNIEVVKERMSKALEGLNS